MAETPEGDIPPAPEPVPEAPAAEALDLRLKLGPLQDPDVGRPRAAQVWTWALAGGGAAGFVAWIAGEYLLDWFTPELPTAAAAGRMTGPDAPTPDAIQAAGVHNAALAFGLLGALLGGFLGFAGGMIRPSARASLAAAFAGIVLGLAAAAGASLAVLPAHQEALARPGATDHELLLAIAALGAVWSASGAAGGVAFGLGMGGRRRVVAGLIGGAVGGLLGAVAFEMIATVAFPLAGATQAISETRESRLVARALVALFVSAGVAALVAPTRFKGTREHAT